VSTHNRFIEDIKIRTRYHTLICTNFNYRLLTAIVLVAVVLAQSGSAIRTTGASPLELIVQARDLTTAVEAVRAVDGQVTHEFASINAVGARLTLAQLERLLELDELRVYEHRGVEVANICLHRA
jgi:hypothetical protein